MTLQNKPGSYIESSGSAMFMAALFNPARLGHLPKNFVSEVRRAAGKCYSYLVDAFVNKNENGTLSYKETASLCKS